MSILDSINTQEYDLCKTLRMNNWQTMWEVVIVGRLDQAIEVMRQNFAISWMMIDAEMYGTTPSANSEKRPSAPPENMLNRSTIVPFC